MIVSLDRDQRNLNIVDDAAEFGPMVSEASTDSSARAVRTAVQTCRSIAIRSLLSLLESSTVKTAAPSQPYLPSSLFEGRLVSCTGIDTMPKLDVSSHNKDQQPQNAKSRQSGSGHRQCDTCGGDCKATAHANDMGTGCSNTDQSQL